MKKENIKNHKIQLDCHPGNPLTGVSLGYVRQGSEQTVCIGKETAGDPGQKPSGMTAHVKTTSGFTLIELLVVVLIIGILTAVALPQYQKAVCKIRATKALTLVKALDTAQAVHKLAQGEYATQLAALDIDLPLSAACEEDIVGGSQTGNCFQYNDFHCWLSKNGNGSCMLDGSHKVWIEKYFARNYYICWVQDQDPISTKGCVLLSNSDKIKHRNTFDGHNYEGYNIIQ